MIQSFSSNFLKTPNRKWNFSYSFQSILQLHGPHFSFPYCGQSDQVFCLVSATLPHLRKRRGRTRLVPHSLVSACCTLSRILEKLARSSRHWRWYQFIGQNGHFVQLFVQHRPKCRTRQSAKSKRLLCYQSNLRRKNKKKLKDFCCRGIYITLALKERSPVWRTFSLFWKQWSCHGSRCVLSPLKDKRNQWS